MPSVSRPMRAWNGISRSWWPGAWEDQAISRCGLVQGFPVPGGELEDGAARGGQGGVSLRRIVPAGGIYCDQLGDGQPCGSSVLQQAGDGRAVDQGRQAGGEDDAAELPPVPLERGAALVERNCLQPGESLAAAGAAEAD